MLNFNIKLIHVIKIYQFFYIISTHQYTHLYFAFPLSLPLSLLFFVSLWVLIEEKQIVSIEALSLRKPQSCMKWDG